MKLTTLLSSMQLSTTKPYSATFKIRSRLSQFLKHVHPDQLVQAPTKIKQQNLKSLTNFNSYIDSINNSKPIQSKLLTFYLAEKTNNKSKKFFSFNIELPSINLSNTSMTQENAKKLIDNIVEVLNKKFKQSQQFKTKRGKITNEQVQKIQNIQFNHLQTEEQKLQKAAFKASPFKHPSSSSIQSQALKSALNAKYLQAQKQSLSNKLKQNIKFADTANNRPLMWSRLANEQSGLYQDFQKIMDQLIDPRLIYFDQNLGSSQIQQFKKRLLPGSLTRESYKSSKIILQICSKMQSFDPPISFYISTKYSSKQIPGFLTIPYNFNPIQLATFYQQQINNIIEQQRKFEQFFDYYQQLSALLSKENNLIVNQVYFKNNNDIWNRILVLKRLQRYKTIFPTEIHAFQRNTFDLFRNKYNIKSTQTVAIYNNKIFLSIDFIDTQMQQIITTLNTSTQPQPTQ